MRDGQDEPCPDMMRASSRPSENAIAEDCQDEPPPVPQVVAEQPSASVEDALNHKGGAKVRKQSFDIHEPPSH